MKSRNQTAKQTSSGTEGTATLRFEREPVEFQKVKAPKSVKRLEIAFCDLESLDGIDRLSSLEELHIHYGRQLHDLSAVGKLKRITKINLYSLPNVKVLFDPAKLEKLIELTYNNVRDLPTIRGIEKLTRLTDLGLSRVKVFDDDYQPLIECQSLRRVFWHGGPFKSPALKEIRLQRHDLLVGGNAVLNG